jgi:hypothetical protein
MFIFLLLCEILRASFFVFIPECIHRNNQYTTLDRSNFRRNRIINLYW